MWVCEGCGVRGIDRLENANKPSLVLGLLEKAKDLIVNTAAATTNVVSKGVSTVILQNSDTPQDPLIKDKEHTLDTPENERNLYSQDKTILRQGKDYIKGAANTVSSYLPGKKRN
jgi:hypothetical protein